MKHVQTSNQHIAGQKPALGRLGQKKIDGEREGRQRVFQLVGHHREKIISPAELLGRTGQSFVKRGLLVLDCGHRRRKFAARGGSLQPSYGIVDDLRSLGLGKGS
ncbi:MAG TPA: hypothetical protein VK550_05190 [Polyangiaceae bacterium]|nr:hypothetical protein [Polyangiaceae bacterium]